MYSHTVTVAQECSFHPSQPGFPHYESESSEEAEPSYFLQEDIHVYTSEFGSCNGCVTELSMCYRALEGATPSENTLTVFLINRDNVTIHVHNVTVDPVVDMAAEGGCKTDGLGSPLCCTTQKLLPSEQFEVHYNFYYALRGYSLNGILGLLTDVFALGYVLDAEIYTLTVGSTVAVEEAEALLRPMFHFTITPGELGRSKY